MAAVMFCFLATDEAEGGVARAGHLIAAILQTDLDLARRVGAHLEIDPLSYCVESLRITVRFAGRLDGVANVDRGRCQPLPGPRTCPC